jgi:hypothetical protein
MLRKRIVGLVIVAAAVAAVYTYLSPQIPRDQVVHFVLGDAAPTVTEVAVRYRLASAPAGEWTREVTFEYSRGKAPRIVTHEARLPNGDYVVEIEIVHDTLRTVVERAVRVGGTTSIELSSAVSPSYGAKDAAPKTPE